MDDVFRKKVSIEERDGKRALYTYGIIGALWEINDIKNEKCADGERERYESNKTERLFNEKKRWYVYQRLLCRRAIFCIDT